MPRIGREGTVDRQQGDETAREGVEREQEGQTCFSASAKQTGGHVTCFGQ